MAKKKSRPRGHMVAQNRRARRDYTISETYEAGMQLTGTEVKSLRLGRATITDAFAGERHGELWLFGAHIPEYPGAANQFNHEPSRARKLLMKRKEIAELLGASQRKGMTIVPLGIYFNRRGFAKLELALGEGKHTYDKRQTVKTRDWNRQKARLIRDKG